MKKRTWEVSLLATLCLLAFTAVRTYSQPVTKPLLWDDHWSFALGEVAQAQQPDYDDGAWRKLDLPHDWSIEGAIDRHNAMGGAGGYFPSGMGWYRKSFVAGANWKGKQVTVYFEGVYRNAEVFINGHSLGKHPYGYTSFYENLTPFIKAGARNVLAVKVDNAQQVNCRWYSGSGIYRHVWLMIDNPVHISQWGVQITTPEVTTEKALVKVKTLVKNETGIAQTIQVKTQLLNASARPAENAQVNVMLEPDEEEEVVQEIWVTQPLLWSPDAPHLYQAHIQVQEGNQVLDVQTVPVGIRSIGFSAATGFRLNGKTYKLNGGCVHHDNGCLGAAAYDRAEQRKVVLLKQAGFNAVRTSHNPPSEAFLAACDSLGMLVIDEAFDGWRESKNKYDYSVDFDAWSERDVQSMVLRDRNHPGIIAWSMGNEIIERKKPEAVTTAQRLVQVVKYYDTTRPVTSAMTTWDKEWEMFDPLFAVQDIGGYNYQLHRAQADHARVPSRVIVQTESYPKDAFYCWNLVQNNAYIIGDFVWTAIDYLGESGIGRYVYPGEHTGEHWEGELYPWHGAYCGDIDLTGWRKPISHYRSMLYSNKEKLYMAVREPEPDTGHIMLTSWAVWPTWESWTWPGREGKPIQVEVYSKYPGVRLYLNDKLIAEQATGVAQEYKATITVPYTAGILKAVGLDGGKETTPVYLTTAEAPATITLKADRKVIKANGQDLLFVDVAITDAEGRLQPNADNRIAFQVSGAGVIAGVDNASLQDTDAYVANNRKAWHGHALLVIKSTHETGEIKIVASAAGLQPGSITVNSR